MQTGETATTAGDARPAPPADRYGSPAKTGSKRWKRWVFGVVAVVVSCAVAWIAYVNLGQASIDAERVAFDARPGNAMQITINVTRDDPDKAGVCIVRVRDKSGAESGRKEVLVPAGAGHSRVSTVVKSIGEPVTADVYGCSYSIPRYMSTP
ncbi:DUF4307 domain-containing protein [Amycolatopsis sp. FDAARGOS 1241]|uniref:DUF4307 domain-containing protein n=1 Tax=Amycolatopsis sp. FDAARGOS 1241 TaxID=2778070 RepID=UPI001951BE66|nr:DUF4307 domain-containing protein [Amycolatopsis sp. FDAARGOS 1241]QRP47185.1 DUF4307 domain-containing protein [Amycolatopsis sp. FDAARGOS 1241]